MVCHDRRPGECDRRCTMTVGRGAVALVEGVDIKAWMRRWKTLNMPHQWTMVLQDYSVLHATSTPLPPCFAQECLAMPIFGSPWVTIDGAQVLLQGRWKDWHGLGVRTVGDICHTGERRWRVAAKCCKQPCAVGDSRVRDGSNPLILAFRAVYEAGRGSRAEPPLL